MIPIYFIGTEERTMPSEEKMTIAERRKYIGILQKRYRKARKGERGRLLDEMEKVTGLSRLVGTRA